MIIEGINELSKCADTGKYFVPHRYCWVNNQLFHSKDNVQEFISALKNKYGAREVEWLPGAIRFICFDGQIRLSDLPEYKINQIVGMDISSAVSVHVLGIKTGDHVLDLCCAPGGKLGISIGAVGKTGSVTGVDISGDRLAICRSLVKRNRLTSENVRLFKADGTRFQIEPPVIIADPWPRQDISSTTLSIAKPKPFYASKCLRVVYEEAYRENNRRLYDKVIVDAECSHDGSMGHIVKYLNSGTLDEWTGKFLSPDRLEELELLQRALIENGFRNLREGGTLVYSTCSRYDRQNELIIQWFLNNHVNDAFLADAHFEALPISKTMSVKDCENEQLQDIRAKTIKFTGNEALTCVQGQKWWTSGLFIAKIIKKTATVSL